MNRLLLITIFLPVAGALLCFGSRAWIRWAALATTLATLALALVLAASFPRGAAEFAVFDVPWFGGSSPSLDIRFSFGLDGLSLWLFALTALLMPVCVLVSWEAISEHVAAYYALLLLLGTGMLGVFAARDIILFYIFFEFTLIPLFFLIGIWGSEERRYAAIKFFLFTLAGSLLTFLGLVAIVVWNYFHSSSGVLTFSIPRLSLELIRAPIEPTLQMWIFIALFAGFAIKVPLFPLHTWLPLAHVQAPTAGSVLLAGVLLKIGTYGFVRFSLPMLPDATVAATPWLLGLSVAGIIYGALVALAQRDIKRLIAYSSVSHLGFCMLGVFAINMLGMEGGVLQMVNHGLSTGALFAVVGMLYERYHTREIARFSGIARRLPVLAFFMLFMSLASIGLPGLNGFVGEFLLLMGMFQRAWLDPPVEWSLQFKIISVLAVSGVVLGAWYMLALVKSVFFGPLHEPGGDAEHAHDHVPAGDLKFREVLALAPLAIVILWIGVWPEFFLARMRPTLQMVTAKVQSSLEHLEKERAIVAEAELQDLAGEPGPRAFATLNAGRSSAARVPTACLANIGLREDMPQRVAQRVPLEAEGPPSREEPTRAR